MLRRQNWARWLALAWMAFHVILSAFPPFKGLVVHVLIFAASLIFCFVLMLRSIFVAVAKRPADNESIGLARQRVVAEAEAESVAIFDIEFAHVILPVADRAYDI